MCGLGVYGCGLGVHGCGLGVYGVRFRSFPAHSVVQTSYTTPTLRFSVSLNRLVGVM